MARYKVIQDVEAEDKLLGPLTLRQFVYAGIMVFCFWLMFIVAAKGAWFLAIPILPFALLAGFFAFPWTREQPTELWALARISFLFKPRKRIWNQSGVKELVTITAPKRIEQIYTDGLSQTEVKSRLKALAETIDSRGWAIKYAPHASTMSAYGTPTNDRLIDPSAIPVEVPTLGNEPYEDIFDPSGGQVGQQFDSMLNANAQAHRAKLVAQMQQPEQPITSPAPTPANDYWFAGPPQGTTAPAASPTTTTATDISQADEATLTAELRDKQQSVATATSHLPTILPIEEQQKLAAAQEQKSTPEPQSTTVTQQPDTAILELAHNDDLNVATIARQAKKAHGDEPADEVIISLH